MSISVSPEHKEALDRMKEALPGMTRSGVVAEIFDMTLPWMEELVDTINQARDDSGNLDEQMARDRLAMWTGQQMLKMTMPYDEEDD